MRIRRAGMLALLFAALTSGSLGMVGCGGEPVQTEQSKEITEQKTKEMQNAMKGFMEQSKKAE